MVTDKEAGVGSFAAHCEGYEHPIYCPAQTYARTMVSPAEYCETEVEQEGDLCPEHEEVDRADADYDHYIESLRKE